MYSMCHSSNNLEYVCIYKVRDHAFKFVKSKENFTKKLLTFPSIFNDFIISQSLVILSLEPIQIPALEPGTW